jgi:integrase
MGRRSSSICRRHPLTCAIVLSHRLFQDSQTPGKCASQHLVDVIMRYFPKLEAPAYRNVVVKYGRATNIRAKVNGLCVHSLRATAPTNALSHEADIAKVQEWLGHANVSTTRLHDRRKMRPQDSPTFSGQLLGPALGAPGRSTFGLPRPCFRFQPFLKRQLSTDMFTST